MIKKAINILWNQKPSDAWTDPDPDDLTVDNAYNCLLYTSDAADD